MASSAAQASDPQENRRAAASAARKLDPKGNWEANRAENSWQQF
jgi:hypothetical protein